MTYRLWAYGAVTVLLLSRALGAVAADPAHIQPGTFMMGCPTGEPGREIDETQHAVTLTRGFEIQLTEVTNQQYTDLAQWAFDHNYVTVNGGTLRDNMGGSTQTLKLLGASYGISFNNGIFSCSNPAHPVAHVTWYGAAAYCDWLSLQQGYPQAYNHTTWQCNGGDPYSAAGFRLPTEAEWEYACRAGSTTAFTNGAITYPDNCAPIDPKLNLIGWYCGNASSVPHQVGQKSANSWGLYDTHGNLWEWCNDWYAAYGSTATDPAGPASGTQRVLRGGNYGNNPGQCRSAVRHQIQPSNTAPGDGFRVARSADLFLHESGSLIDPAVRLPGESFSMHYRVTNTSAAGIEVGLGCSIRRIDAAAWIDDPAHDVVVTIPANSTTTMTRQFRIPVGAAPGVYEVWYALRDRAFTNYFSHFTRTDLTVETPQTRRAEVLEYMTSLTADGNGAVLCGQMAGYASGTREYPGFANSYERHIEELSAATDRHPAIVGLDYGFSSVAQRDTANAILGNHVACGGIVAVSWHAENPWGFVFSTGNGVSLNLQNPADALESVSLTTNWFPHFVEDLVSGVSNQYTDTWMNELAQIGNSLHDLKARGAVVLWRPFHEMNGAWFWWGGRDPSHFRQLWIHMRDYFEAEPYNLDNLIWVFSPNETNLWLSYDHNMFPAGYADIFGVDTYGTPLDIDLVNQIAGMNLGIPLCLGEFGAAPSDAISPAPDYDINSLLTSLDANIDGHRICAVQFWHHPWAVDSALGARTFMNSPRVITRDELPWACASSAVPTLGVDELTLVDAYPNPFNAAVTIAFASARAANVRLDVFDIAGRHVKTIWSEQMVGPGRHETNWDGKDERGMAAPAGVYFYRLKSGSFVGTKRIILVK